MKKILVLGVASPQYDAIEILNELGYETHAIAKNNDGPGALIAKKFTELDILDIEGVENYIIDNNIDVVYSTGSDLSMPVLNKISEKLNLPHFVTEETARICNNKDLMRQKLGIDFEGNVNFQIISNIDETIELEFPFIMKPTDSQGQRGVNLISNMEDFNALFEETKSFSRSGKVIIEQYIDGPEISVNGYVIDGEIVYLTASDRITWPKYIGLIHKHIVPTKSLDEQSYIKLKTIMNNLVKKMEILNGPIYAQVKVENNIPYVIEVTPRLDGCHMWNLLKRHNGVDLMKLTFEHLLENDTSEIDNLNNNDYGYELKFICQEPNTKANYLEYSNDLEHSEASFLYYENGQDIRPVNGKYEKIGYMINKI